MQWKIKLMRKFHKHELVYIIEMILYALKGATLTLHVIMNILG